MARRSSAVLGRPPVPVRPSTQNSAGPILQVVYEVREGGSHWVRGFAGALVVVIAALGFVVWSPVPTPLTEFGFHASLVVHGPSPALAPGAAPAYSMQFVQTEPVASERA